MGDFETKSSVEREVMANQAEYALGEEPAIVPCECLDATGFQLEQRGIPLDVLRRATCQQFELGSRG